MQESKSSDGSITSFNSQALHTGGHIPPDPLCGGVSELGYFQASLASNSDLGVDMYLTFAPPKCWIGYDRSLKYGRLE